MRSVDELSSERTRSTGLTTSYTPILACAQTSLRRPVGPIAYDCARVIVVRDGSAILTDDLAGEFVTVGDVILIGPERAAWL